MIRHVEARDRVTLVFVTDGRRSRAGGLAPDRMAAVRRREAEAAAGVLGIDDWRWLGLSEGAWSVEPLASRLAELLEELAPDLVYWTSRVDYHPEHLRVARALANALTICRRQVEVRAYPVQVPLGRLANQIVEIGDRADAILDAMRRHRSQASNVGRALRMRRYAAARHRAPGMVEELWRLDSQRFVALHGEGPRREEGAEARGPLFRGLRERSWSDPLAYLRGRRERLRLARDADEDPRGP